MHHPVISGLSLLSLLLCWGLGGCRRTSPAPQLTDLRSQISGVEELLEEFRKQLQQQRAEPGQEEEEDWHRHRQRGNGRDQEDEAAAMQQQLQEVAVRPSGDSGEDLCSFNQLEDYIIRTKDSLEAGATFLKAPGEVYSWKQCLEECCSQPRCSAAVVEGSGRGLACFLFDCSHHGRSVCQFSPHRDYSSFTLTGRNSTGTNNLDADKPPISNAGQDVVLQLPVDWVILDGRESNDDHAIVRYEWALLQGDPQVELKVPQPGTLRLSHMQEGVYTLQLTVTDTSGQKSSDNVSVTVLPEEHHKSVSSGRKTVIHISDKTRNHAVSGIDNGKESKVTGQISVSSNAERNQTLLEDLNRDSMSKKGSVIEHTTLDPQGNLEAVLGSVSSKTEKDAVEENFLLSKDILKGNGHPAPEAGAVLPLALGLAITSLLLLMVVCRLQLVRQKLKKARPLTSEESDYLINGMYL
ncbi:hypothetical protein GDO81_008234 [Engystomops pustulosus]|uniref:Low-density lipoprotein receptor-related protein 11 n=1 Tax=Engystomops pustulosus TaxID=76066 RepID=A0AAV7CD48_ENGPU|nr:hypothetical protein GDO81_008234 [Engystomops pustulosus]